MHIRASNFLVPQALSSRYMYDTIESTLIASDVVVLYHSRLVSLQASAQLIDIQLKVVKCQVP